MEVVWAALVRLASPVIDRRGGVVKTREIHLQLTQNGCGYAPRGWPSFAKAAADTNSGRATLKPRIVVDGSHLDAGRITRAWKKKRVKARAFSALAGYRIMIGTRVKYQGKGVLY